MRGLFLAVFALLIVAGDSGRYVPQLIVNATRVLAPLSQDLASAPTGVAGATSSVKQEVDGAVQQSTASISPDHSLSSTHLNYDHNAINNALALLWLASIQGSENAQSRLLAHFERAYNEAFAPHSFIDEATATYFLEKLVNLENADAAWLLYQILGEEGASQRFMRLAALGEVAEAQLAFAMSTESPEKREKWLVRAASQNYLPAQAALADWYLLHGQHQLAKPLLATTANVDMQSAFKYGRLLWDEGEFSESKKHFSFASKKGHLQASRALEAINLYTPYSIKQAVEQSSLSNWKSRGNCLQRIQPFATSLATIMRAHSLYNSFNDDTRLQNLSICLAPPIWLKSDVLSCNPDYKNAGVLGCNITPLASIAKKQKFSHAVVVAEQGKANVQNGVMYLDISDAYSVFVHELAHFAGFADEYPIGTGMANKLCDEDEISDFSPPNLVVDSEYWYAPHETVENWLEIDPTTIIARAKTCTVLGKNSYKPSRRITFMEHHDSGVIPPLYLVLWQQQLEKQNAQRPISMNFFQAFHNSGNQKEAAHWLAEYEVFTGTSHH
ncbi:sel1 repeat family protein [Alteromonas sp. S015]|uniref:sel1 repeat family protein n=1 Tax=Alteromonas sp. S015 TaxID=3117401 RepID=UPI002FE1239D